MFNATKIWGLRNVSSSFYLRILFMTVVSSLARRDAFVISFTVSAVLWQKYCYQSWLMIWWCNSCEGQYSYVAEKQIYPPEINIRRKNACHVMQNLILICYNAQWHLPIIRVSTLQLLLWRNLENVTFDLLVIQTFLHDKLCPTKMHDSRKRL